MREWSVELDTPHTVHSETRLYELTADLVKALSDHAAVASPGRRTLSVRLNVVTAGPTDAIGAAWELVRSAFRTVGFPGTPDIVRVEVETIDEQARRLKEPTLPTFAGISEVAEILGVTRQRAHQLAQTGSFPKPLASLAAGPIWNRHAIERFAERWTRQPGRPRLVQVTAAPLLGRPIGRIRRPAAKKTAKRVRTR
ncbi:MAG: hypothetical protein HY334_04485 [Armatimonadetes bacterium]|nr:hypothetical protein [Armatimonadota bacterium]